MNIRVLDQYKEGHGILYRLDPRAKLVGMLVFVLGVVLTPVAHWTLFGAYFILLLALIVVTHVSFRYLIKRLVVAFPFIIMAILFIPFVTDGEVIYSFPVGNWNISLTSSGIELMGTLLAKAWLSVICIAVFMYATRIYDFFKGLERLGCPRVLVMLLNVMYRYIFVIHDEAVRLKQARDSRYFGGGLLLNIKTVGYMAGSLFVRSYERAERIYNAMLARGYDGINRTIKMLHFGAEDIIFALIWILLVMLVGISGQVGLI